MMNQNATMFESTVSPAEQGLPDTYGTGSKVTSRTMDKCAECRRRRKACRPIDRKWPEDGKCDECVKARLQCGPNTRLAVGMGSDSYPPNSLDSPESATARAVTQAQWNHIRDLFKRLYLDEGRTLKDVITIMQNEHHFTASRRQYHRQIEAWGLQKYKKLANSRTGTPSNTSSPSHENAELARLSISSSVEPRNIIQMRLSERPQTLLDHARHVMDSVPMIGRKPLQHTILPGQATQDNFVFVQPGAGQMSICPPLIRPRDIRLIRLLPGNRNEPISIELLVTDLDHAEMYEAVSWAWEFEEETETVLVHGDAFHIKRGLESALHLFRDESMPRLLWVDAICINQNDLAEKSEQVQLMPDIYFAASGVLVWLGADTVKSFDAIMFVKTILDVNSLETLLNFPKSMPLWKAFGAMLNLRWFCRAWALQEVSFAKSCILHWGSSMVSWPDFVDAVHMVSSLDGSLRDLDIGWSRDFFQQLQVSGVMRLISTSRLTAAPPPNGRLAGHGPSLETLLNMYRPSHLKDPRDRIYCLLFLSRDWKPDDTQRKSENVVPNGTPNFDTPSTTDTGLERLNFTFILVDYRKEVRKVCIEVVELVLKQSDSVDIICRPWAPEWLGLPSWISTLDRDSFRMAKNGLYTRVNADALVGGPDHIGKPYNACNKTQTRQGRVGHIFETGIFAIQGFAVCRISQVASVAVEGCVPADWLKLGKWNNVEDPPPDAFWRTLVADRDETGKKPPPTWFRRVCSWAFNQPVSGEALNTNEMLRMPACPPYVAIFLRRMQSVVWKRKLFVTVQGYIGIGPEHILVGDSVNILVGCSVPVVLREVLGDVEYHHLIGDCYVHGMMDGEACRDAPMFSDYYLR